MAFTVTGIETVTQRLQAMQAQVLQQAAIALEQQADAILEQSDRLVPVDTSSLRDSASVDRPQLTATTASVTMRYGGTIGYQGRVPERYAIRIHEDTFLNHPRGGQAHFLSLPLFAAEQQILANIADAITRSL